MGKHSPYAILNGGIMYTQSDPLKESKDLKNLVNGDYEREYRVMVEKRGKKRGLRLGVLAALGVVITWLVILTVLRELQLSRLRAELGDLSARVVNITATLNMLEQRLRDEDDDLAYRDLDMDISIEEPSGGRSKPGEADVDKLQGLTVLGTDGYDDADDYDDEAEESGDWYPDYDNRRAKVGKTKMVKLKPEDFTGSMVTLGDKRSSNSVIREIKRMLNENPEVPDSDLAAAAAMSPEAVAAKSGKGEVRTRRSMMSLSQQEMLSSRWDMLKMKDGSDPKMNMVMPARSGRRSARDSDGESGRKPFIAAHFHGNTSHLSTQIHEHYKGNGLVRVGHDAAHDVWYPSLWTQATPERPTLTRNGHVHVRHTGVYLVYVQIYYLDAHDIVSWVLHRTNSEIAGREPVLQCAQSTHSIESRDRPNSCFSAAALFLKAGDKLAVRNTGGERHSLMQPEKSFIGLVKLADAEDPEPEF